MNDFNSLIERTIESIHASETRKQSMRDELMSHLQSAYDEELREHHDERLATQIALDRLGDINELRRQLQSSVPGIEQLWAVVFRKEIPMSARLLVVGWFMAVAIVACFVPREIPGLIISCLIGAAGIWRLADRTSARWLGPRWGWRIVAVLFGMALIMPALANMKQNSGTETAALVSFLSLGILMVLIGIVSAITALTTPRQAA